MVVATSKSYQALAHFFFLISKVFMLPTGRPTLQTLINGDITVKVGEELTVL